MYAFAHARECVGMRVRVCNIHTRTWCVSVSVCECVCVYQRDLAIDNMNGVDFQYDASLERLYISTYICRPYIYTCRDIYVHKQKNVYIYICIYSFISTYTCRPYDTHVETYMYTKPKMHIYTTLYIRLYIYEYLYRSRHVYTCRVHMSRLYIYTSHVYSRRVSSTCVSCGYSMTTRDYMTTRNFGIIQMHICRHPRTTSSPHEE